MPLKSIFFCLCLQFQPVMLAGLWYLRTVRKGFAPGNKWRDGRIWHDLNTKLLAWAFFNPSESYLTKLTTKNLSIMISISCYLNSFSIWQILSGRKTFSSFLPSIAMRYRFSFLCEIQRDILKSQDSFESWRFEGTGLIASNFDSRNNSVTVNLLYWLAALFLVFYHTCRIIISYDGPCNPFPLRLSVNFNLLRLVLCHTALRALWFFWWAAFCWSTFSII